MRSYRKLLNPTEVTYIIYRDYTIVMGLVLAIYKLPKAVNGCYAIRILLQREKTRITTNTQN